MGEAMGGIKPPGRSGLFRRAFKTKRRHCAQVCRLHQLIAGRSQLKIKIVTRLHIGGMTGGDAAIAFAGAFMMPAAVVLSGSIPHVHGGMMISNTFRMNRRRNCLPRKNGAR